MLDSSLRDILVMYVMQCTSTPMQVSAWLTRHLVAVLSWLWIATAGLAFGDPYIRLLLQGSPTGCEEYSFNSDTYKVCQDSQPIAILSVVAGAICEYDVLLLKSMFC